MTRLILSIFIAVCSLCMLNSCSGKKTGEEQQTEKVMRTDGKKLVVFFSRKGENEKVGYVEKGNTHIVADMIAGNTGADIFEIVPEKPYSETSYDECVNMAKMEKEANARPSIVGDINIEDYDVIFIGYPNWWGVPPMCVFTFIEKHDWNGKTVIPFITHEGSGMGGTDEKVAESCAGAAVAVGKGFAVRGSEAQNQRKETNIKVAAWLKSLGF